MKKGALITILALAGLAVLFFLKFLNSASQEFRPKHDTVKIDQAIGAHLFVIPHTTQTTVPGFVRFHMNIRSEMTVLFT
jgi:hypothetical protein